MPIPVLNLTQMRAWESATLAAGQKEDEIIRRVGKRLARRARKLTRAGDTILILAGKGHNGEDAAAAKPGLDGRKVKLVELLLPSSDHVNLEIILKEKPDLIIDGIFGIGLNRPLGEAWKKIIEMVNASGIPVLSVDVPSGLNAETGESFGAVIHAQVTLAVGAPKIGLLSPRAWAAVGRLEVTGDVGFGPCTAKSELGWVLPSDFTGFPKPRSVASNKGSYGHAVLFTGAPGFHGAAVLAAQGALRAQPGLVTVVTRPEVYLPVAAQLAAPMVKVWASDEPLPARTTAILVGPGLAGLKPTEMTAMAEFLNRLWQESSLPVIVDASALEWLTPGESGAGQQVLRVLTPHPGEAARLLNTTVEAVQSNRLQALRDLSKKFNNCWVVLKGHQTLIGRATDGVLVNSSGNPYLAQGGSGDLLAGFLTGLLAQPTLQEVPLQTISYAVWRHGAAADELQSTRTNWTIEDLAQALSAA